MKKTVSIFKTHDEAVHALEELKECGVDINKVSLVGRAEIVDDKIHVKSNRALIAAPVVIGIIVGSTIGLLTGIGTFAIPGFGFLYNAGAEIGALAGFEVGVAAGGLITILLGLGVKEDKIAYEEHVKEGRFLMYIDGTEAEISRAQMVIEGKHLGMAVH
jgi:hypothetical protein